MKKIIILFAMLACITGFAFSEGAADTSVDRQTSKAQEQTKAIAMSQIPIPNVKYFVERATIARWIERWDKPAVTTYVYLVSYGQFIGYYVCNGKPASTKSYLTPEYKQEYYGNGAVIQTQQPDLDGTLGDNCEGIRFFTAEGTAVEWGGSGACYIYSDQRLPVNAPKLNFSK